jgi:hypothetical protein
MFLNDALEHRWITGSIPGAVGIHNGDWAAFADPEAVRFRAQNAAPVRELQLFQAFLEVVPGFEAPRFLAAFRRALIAAEKDVTPCSRDANVGSNLE